MCGCMRNFGACMQGLSGLSSGFDRSIDVMEDEEGDGGSYGANRRSYGGAAQFFDEAQGDDVDVRIPL
jgi:hypothetical protein